MPKLEPLNNVDKSNFETIDPNREIDVRD